MKQATLPESLNWIKSLLLLQQALSEVKAALFCTTVSHGFEQVPIEYAYLSGEVNRNNQSNQAMIRLALVVMNDQLKYLSDGLSGAIQPLINKIQEIVSLLDNEHELDLPSVCDLLRDYSVEIEQKFTNIAIQSLSVSRT